MTQSDVIFQGAIPEAYDRYLGPLLFEPFASDLAASLPFLEEGDLLETAAGTGIATRALDAALPGPVRIVSTDLNQPMLDAAAERLASARVTWRQADAQALPFHDDSFDAVVCQFGVMFFPDKPLGYREACRVLRPGGRFVFNVWDKIEENEVVLRVMEALAVSFPADPPTFMRRIPHGYHDARTIGSELRDAGFQDMEVRTVSLSSHVLSYRDPAIGFCQGSPMRGEILSRDPDGLEEVTEAVAEALAERFGKEPFEAKLQAHVITGRLV